MKIFSNKINIFLLGSYKELGLQDNLVEVLDSKKFNVISIEKKDAISTNKFNNLKSRADYLILSINPSSKMSDIEDIMYTVKNPKRTVVYFSTSDIRGKNFEKSEYDYYKVIVESLKTAGIPIVFDLKPLIEVVSKLEKPEEKDPEETMYLLNYYNILQIKEDSGIITDFTSLFLEKRSHVVSILAKLIELGKNFTFFIYKDGISFKDMRDSTNIKWQEEKAQILEDAKLQAQKSLEESKLENNKETI